MSNVIVAGQAIPLDELVTWVAWAGGLLGIVAAVVTQLLFIAWARIKPPLPTGNKKRGISLIVPFLLILSWYGILILSNHDVADPSRLWLWFAVGCVGATGKQIGWFIYLAVRGEEPPPGQEVPTLSQVAALLRGANWATVLANLPALLDALFPAQPPPPQP
jgi:hypothetical protein